MEQKGDFASLKSFSVTSRPLQENERQMTAVLGRAHQ